MRSLDAMNQPPQVEHWKGCDTCFLRDQLPSEEAEERIDLVPRKWIDKNVEYLLCYGCVGLVVEHREWQNISLFWQRGMIQ